MWLKPIHKVAMSAVTVFLEQLTNTKAKLQFLFFLTSAACFAAQGNVSTWWVSRQALRSLARGHFPVQQFPNNSATRLFVVVGVWRSGESGLWGSGALELRKTFSCEELPVPSFMTNPWSWVSWPPITTCRKSKFRNTPVTATRMNFTSPLPR